MARIEHFTKLDTNIDNLYIFDNLMPMPLVANPKHYPPSCACNMNFHLRLFAKILHYLSLLSIYLVWASRSSSTKRNNFLIIQIFNFLRTLMCCHYYSLLCTSGLDWLT